MPVRLSIALEFAMLQLGVLGADQSPSLTGTWALEAAAAEGVTADGGSWSLGTLSGTLTLEQKGKRRPVRGKAAIPIRGR